MRYAELYHAMPDPSIQQLLAIQEQGSWPLPIDHMTDSRDLFELSTGEKGVPQDRNQRLYVLSIREDRLLNKIRHLYLIPTQCMTADAMTKPMSSFPLMLLLTSGLLLFFNMDKHPIIRRTLEKQLPGFAETELHKSDSQHKQQNKTKHHNYHNILFATTLAITTTISEAADHNNPIINPIITTTTTTTIINNNDNIQIPHWAFIIMLLYLLLHIVKDTVSFVCMVPACLKQTKTIISNMFMFVCCCCCRKTTTTQPVISEVHQQLDELISQTVYMSKYGKAYHRNNLCGCLVKSEQVTGYSPCSNCLNNDRKQQKSLLSFLEEAHRKTD